MKGFYDFRLEAPSAISNWRQLTTAIVLMFVAGGLLWLNVSPTYYEVTTSTADVSNVFGKYYGWPMISFVDFIPVEVPNGWIWSNLAINFATVLASLATVAFICEWAVRRREARAP